MLATPQTQPIDYSVIYYINGSVEESEYRKDIIAEILNHLYGNHHNYIEVKLKQHPTYHETKHLRNGLYITCLRCDIAGQIPSLKDIKYIGSNKNQYEFKINKTKIWTVQISPLNSGFVVVKDNLGKLKVEDVAFIKGTSNYKTNEFADSPSANEWKEKIENAEINPFLKPLIPIGKKDVKSKLIVHKGDPIHILYKEGNITIRSKAVALTPGALKEIIKVKIPFKDKSNPIYAKVINKGEVVYEIKP